MKRVLHDDKQITFFGDYHTPAGRGFTCFIEKTDHRNPSIGTFYLFSPSEIDFKKTVETLSLSTREEYPEYIKRREARDEIFIEVFDGSLNFHFGSIEPPKTALFLSSGDLTPKHMSIEEIKHINPGDHLIFPVTQDAETRLHTFIEGLTWFSEDAQIQVLHTLRHPGFDERLRFLEREYFDKKPRVQTQPAGVKNKENIQSKPGGPKRPTNPRALRGIKKKSKQILLTSLAVSVILNVVLGFHFAGKGFSSNHETAETIQNTAGNGQQPTEKTPDAKPTEQIATTKLPKEMPKKPKDDGNHKDIEKPDLKDKKTLQIATKLFEEMRKKADDEGTRENIKKLYNLHFEKIEKQNSKDKKPFSEIIFQKKIENHFSWGVIKLWALLYSKNELEEEIFHEQAWTKTKELFRSLTEKHPLNEENGILLGTMACYIKFNKEETKKDLYDEPGIPATRQKTNKEFKFIKNKDCKILTGNKDGINKGLSALLERLKEFK